MAAAIPAKLKHADVQRFATRAAQLEKFRPIVTYWCEYYILQQILNKSLHAGDDEVQSYAIRLMDKLETFKTTHAAEDAVTDDVAAKAYCEQFALTTFARGDDEQRNNKVGRQTADTFTAAATFLDMLSIWGPLDSEVSAKTKFAKFHALRIARALKAGEDPNDTNPVVEQPKAPETDGEAELDAELRAMEGNNGGYQPPTVESVEGSAYPGSTPLGNAPEIPILPQEPSAPPAAEDAPEVSPIEPSDEQTATRSASIGGGYFPSVPGQVSTSNYEPSPPGGRAVTEADLFSPSIDDETHIPPQQSPAPPTDPSSFYASAKAPPPSILPPAPAAYTAPPPAPAALPHVPAPAVRQGLPPGGYRTDDESVMAAQKHAKWAISALNFEDVNTAVRELRIALQNLGA